MKFPRSTSLVAIVLFGLSCSALAQQNPNGQLPISSLSQPYVFLIRDPMVHQDLGLKARQRQAIKALSDELDGPIWSMRNKSQQHIDKTLQAATVKARKRLATILTTDQQNRLEEIELWALGVRSLELDHVANRLEINAAQSEAIHKTLVDTRQAIGQLSERLQSGESRDSLEDEAKGLRTTGQQTIVATLNRRQQQLWAELLGKRIDVSKLGRVKFKAPQLDTQDGWINSAPLTMQQLKGKVVALHFFAFG